MTIKILTQHSCEPCFSESVIDTRFELDIDHKLKVQVVRCDDKHSRELGNTRIERIMIGPINFWPSAFSDLPPEYNIDLLEERIQSFLENN